MVNITSRSAFENAIDNGQIEYHDTEYDNDTITKIYLDDEDNEYFKIFSFSELQDSNGNILN
jgi:hypothetical protein